MLKKFLSFLLMFVIFINLNACKKSNLVNIFLADWQNKTRNEVVALRCENYEYQQPYHFLFIAYDTKIESFKNEIEANKYTLLKNNEEKEVYLFYKNNNYYCFYEVNNNLEYSVISLVAVEIIYKEYHFLLPMNAIDYLDYSYKSSYLKNYFMNNDYNDVKTYYEKFSSGIKLDDIKQTVKITTYDLNTNEKIVIVVDYLQKSLSLLINDILVNIEG